MNVMRVQICHLKVEFEYYLEMNLHSRWIRDALYRPILRQKQASSFYFDGLQKKNNVTFKNISVSPFLIQLERHG